MNEIRIALANIRFPANPAESITLAENAIAEAAMKGAFIVAFPECFIPGYRSNRRPLLPPDRNFLENGWSLVCDAAARAKIHVVLATERVVDVGVVATALVIDDTGVQVGFQDKVQIDPSEEPIYTPGTGRRIFQIGPLTFGIVICHEGFRYPETVRWAARNGAQIVFHPQFHEAEGDSYRPTTYADPANTFHETAMICRAAENTCYFATINYASPGSPTTSAVISPDGTVLCYQPYGREGLLIADLDLDTATGLLAKRYKPIPG